MLSEIRSVIWVLGVVALGVVVWGAVVQYDIVGIRAVSDTLSRLGLSYLSALIFYLLVNKYAEYTNRRKLTPNVESVRGRMLEALNEIEVALRAAVGENLDEGTVRAALKNGTDVERGPIILPTLGLRTHWLEFLTLRAERLEDEAAAAVHLYPYMRVDAVRAFEMVRQSDFVRRAHSLRTNALWHQGLEEMAPAVMGLRPLVVAMREADV